MGLNALKCIQTHIPQKWQKMVTNGKIICNERTNGRTDKTDFIGPFDFQPGTKKVRHECNFFRAFKQNPKWLGQTNKSDSIGSSF